MNNNKNGLQGGRGDPPCTYGSRGDPARLAGSQGNPFLMNGTRGVLASSGNKRTYPPLSLGFEPWEGPEEVGNTRDGPKRRVFSQLITRGKPMAAIIGGKGEVCLEEKSWSMGRGAWGCVRHDGYSKDCGVPPFRHFAISPFRNNAILHYCIIALLRKGEERQYCRITASESFLASGILIGASLRGTKQSVIA